MFLKLILFVEDLNETVRAELIKDTFCYQSRLKIMSFQKRPPLNVIIKNFAEFPVKPLLACNLHLFKKETLAQIFAVTCPKLLRISFSVNTYR